MKPLNRSFVTKPGILLVGLLLVLLSCEKDEEPEENKDSIEIELLSGVVQKGPFINGTSVDISELDELLNQTGLNYSTKISNNYGAFELEDLTLTSQYIGLKGLGYYYNEVAGEISSSQLDLHALADITNRTTVNINLLTHLETPRVEYLIKQGKSFAEAKVQAQAEVLGIFGLGSQGISASEDLAINSSSEGNAKLLAISVILQGNRTVAEMSELLAHISNDIEEDGILDNIVHKAALYNSVTSTDLNPIAGNLENRFSELGISAEIPEYVQYLDSFRLSGVLDGFEIEVNHVTCFGWNNGSIGIEPPDDGSTYTYEWSNGETAAVISALIAGDYSVSVIQDMNVLFELDFKVEEPEKQEYLIDITSTPIDLSQGAISISPLKDGDPVSTEGYVFNWTDPVSDQSGITDLAMGLYEVVIESGTDCYTEHQIRVPGTFIDARDMQEYTATKIGGTIWMAENLNYYTPEGSYYYDNDSIEYAEDFGRLYLWDTLMNGEVSSDENPGTVRGISPEGWHIPSKSEYESMIEYVETNISSTNPAGALKKVGWWDGDENNLSGFSALPAGWKKESGLFTGMGGFSFHGTCTESDEERSYNLQLTNSTQSIAIIYKPKLNAFSIRCVKDE